MAETPPELPSVTVVLGGARSGKSAFAERLAERAPRPLYLATASVVDEEMRRRIALHRARRGARWRTVEESVELVGALRAHCAVDTAVVVDCLTLWLGNLMHADRDLDAEAGALIESLADLAGPVVLVSNEVGWGIVPDNALAREFRDRTGRLHQDLARLAERVYLIVAGLALPLKGGGDGLGPGGQ